MQYAKNQPRDQQNELGQRFKENCILLIVFLDFFEYWYFLVIHWSPDQTEMRQP